MQELTRSAPLERELVTTSWSSISPESKLQILQSKEFLPGWLLDLATSDASAIVRWWASKSHFFRSKHVGWGPEGKLFGQPLLFCATDQDEALYDAIVADSCELVRLCAKPSSSFYKEEDRAYLKSGSQLQRLVFVRRSGWRLSDLLRWVEHALSDGVSDDDLAECSREALALARIRKELAEPRSEILDGFTAFDRGKAIELGWRLVASAGPRLQNLLMNALPTRLGLHTVKAEELAALPDDVLVHLVWRRDSEEVLALCDHIRKNPDDFSKEVTTSNAKALEADEEFPRKARGPAPYGRRRSTGNMRPLSSFFCSFGS